MSTSSMSSAAQIGVIGGTATAFAAGATWKSGYKVVGGVEGLRKLAQGALGIGSSLGSIPSVLKGAWTSISTFDPQTLGYMTFRNDGVHVLNGLGTIGAGARNIVGHFHPNESADFLIGVGITALFGIATCCALKLVADRKDGAEVSLKDRVKKVTKDMGSKMVGAVALAAIGGALDVPLLATVPIVQALYTLHQEIQEVEKIKKDPNYKRS